MNSGERTLLRIYSDSKGCIGYNKMITTIERREMAELIVMVKMLGRHLEDEYEDIFIESKVMDDTEEAKIRDLIDINPHPDDSEVE
jgi:hypothetical protein